VKAVTGLTLRVSPYGPGVSALDVLPGIIVVEADAGAGVNLLRQYGGTG